jgi:hypothetical protein
MLRTNGGEEETRRFDREGQAEALADGHDDSVGPIG